jgi:TolB protein
VNTIKYPSFNRRIANSIATTNNDNDQIRSRIPARTRFGGFAVSAMLLLSGLVLATQINQPAWAGTFPGPNGQIAFDSDRDTPPDQEEDENPNREIYVMNPDGTDQTRLTNNDEEDIQSSWSPDGEKIAFASNRDGNLEIYVMNADGTDQTRLTNNDAIDINPSWSPDGEKIAFSSDRDDDEGRNDIYVMDATDGSDVTRLTDTDADDRQPSWSPDGEKIAFNRVFNPEDVDVDDGQIFVMNADDGSDVTRLTDNDHDDKEPDWGTNTSTPDGDGKKDDKKKNDHKDKKDDY